jgi:stalled ribosome rescue protein Dom34
MSTYHAVVWMDHAEAHVLMFDSAHVQGERIHSRSKHSRTDKHPDNKVFFTEIVQALAGTHEVLLTGAGNARTEFKTWCDSHAKACAHTIIENVASDHPTDPQLIALARKYFVKFDKMAANPSLF